MIPANEDIDHTKQLSSEELAEVRDCWGMGCPLAILARQRDIDEQELRRQLGLPALTPEPAHLLFNPGNVAQEREKRRQIDALLERFGSQHE